LAVKTASEMTYTVSGGTLNSAQSNPIHPIKYSFNEKLTDRNSQLKSKDGEC